MEVYDVIGAKVLCSHGSSLVLSQCRSCTIADTGKNNFTGQHSVQTSDLALLCSVVEGVKRLRSETIMISPTIQL